MWYHLLSILKSRRFVAHTLKVILHFLRVFSCSSTLMSSWKGRLRWLQISILFSECLLHKAFKGTEQNAWKRLQSTDRVSVTSIAWLPGTQYLIIYIIGQSLKIVSNMYIFDIYQSKIKTFKCFNYQYLLNVEIR